MLLDVMCLIYLLKDASKGLKFNNLKKKNWSYEILF